MTAGERPTRMIETHTYERDTGLKDRDTHMTYDCRKERHTYERDIYAENDL